MVKYAKPKVNCGSRCDYTGDNIDWGQFVGFAFAGGRWLRSRVKLYLSWRRVSVRFRGYETGLD